MSMYVSWSLDRLEDRQSVEQCVYYRLLRCALRKGVCMRRAALAVMGATRGARSPPSTVRCMSCGSSAHLAPGSYT